MIISCLRPVRPHKLLSLAVDGATPRSLPAYTEYSTLQVVRNVVKSADKGHGVIYPGVVVQEQHRHHYNFWTELNKHVHSANLLNNKTSRTDP